MSGLGVAAGLGAAAAGVALLRGAWATRSPRLAVAGWLALALGAPGWRLAGVGWDTATATAALAPSLAALAVLAAAGATELSAPRRLERPQPAPAPPAGREPLRVWRGAARAACIGPLAGIAALALAAAVAAHGPGADGDRLVGAELATPLAWGAAAAWAAIDPRLARVAASLAALALAASAAALL